MTAMLPVSNAMLIHLGGAPAGRDQLRHGRRRGGGFRRGRASGRDAVALASRNGVADG